MSAARSPAGGAVSGTAPAGAAGSVRDQRARTRRAPPGHRQQRIHPGGGHRAPGPDRQPVLPAAGGLPGGTRWTCPWSTAASPPSAWTRGLPPTAWPRSVRRRQLIIPGVVAPLKEELAAYTGWDIRVGPICVAELPLFLGEATGSRRRRRSPENCLLVDGRVLGEAGRSRDCRSTGRLKRTRT